MWLIDERHHFFFSSLPKICPSDFSCCVVVWISPANLNIVCPAGIRAVFVCLFQNMINSGFLIHTFLPGHVYPTTVWKPLDSSVDYLSIQSVKSIKYQEIVEKWPSQCPRAQSDIFIMQPTVQNPKMFNLRWHQTERNSKSLHLRSWNQESDWHFNKYFKE